MLTLQAEFARDVMTVGPYSVAATDTPAEAAEFLTDRGFGAAVVIDDAGHPVGVVTKTDLLIHQREASGETAKQATVQDVMTPAVFTVRPDTPIRSVVEQLLVLNVHHLFVADETGTIVGVITPTDLVRKLR